MSKPQQIELTGGNSEPLLKSAAHGEYKYTAEDLAALTHMANRYEVAKGEAMKLSSQMFVEKFQGAEALAQDLFTNLKTGIEGTGKDRADRISVYGANAFPPPKLKSLWELVAENFEDTINQILCGAAIVSIVIGLIQHGFPEGLIEGTSILIALNIIIVVNSGNNWLSEKRLADLVKLSDRQEVAVFRGSEKAITMDSEELLVGDLVLIEAGMKVPADMVLVSGQDIACTEGDLTGEPDAVPKELIDADNYGEGQICTMLAKSLVQTGVGKAIVVAVGYKTQAGIIAEKTQTPTQPTLLQEKLEAIASKIGNVGIGCAVLTFIAMLVRTALEVFEILPCGCGNITTCVEPPVGTCKVPNFALNMTTNPLWNQLLDTVIIAITVIVVAIPEGLPLAVTISLSFASAKMNKQNCLVRKLASSETMGGATHICSDKTGTLTLNDMTVMACMTLGRSHTSDDFTDKLAREVHGATKEISEASSGQTHWDKLVEAVLWNSSARLERNDGKDPKKPVAKFPWVTAGNVTEQGLLKFYMHILQGEGCVAKQGDKTEENILCLIPFTSRRKRAAIVIRNAALAGTGQEVRVYCKGAPDVLFPHCTNADAAGGAAADFSAGSEARQLFDDTVKAYADQAFRTLLVTYRDMSLAEYEQLKAGNNGFAKDADREVLETGLTAIGIFGLQDPLRPTIVASIKQCKAAGIQVIMCTGDNIDTAIAISKNAGIVTPEQLAASEYTAMTGKDFDAAVGGLKQVAKPGGKAGETVDLVRNMKKFREIKQYLRVLARSSPEDKYTLVTGIQDAGGVVAVTGDGTNDAPALTKADVGFAMGIAGTDVAQGACDIVLLDDNFSTIITALRFGRNVYDNVRKFLQFQLTVNVVAMFIVFFGSVVLKDSPLNAVQMLWVNLIMDTFAALALATEPPAFDILTRQPYDKDAAIVTEVMWRNVFGHAIYQIVALCVVIFFAAPMGIIYNYEVACFAYTIEGKSTSPCKLGQRNPFYTQSLYYDTGSAATVAGNIEWWKQEYKETFSKNGAVADVDARKAMTASFNAELLQEMNCQEYVRQNPKEEGKVDCSTFYKVWDKKHPEPAFKDKDGKARWLLPQDLPDNGPSQKLLHYTMVFQVFVFMQLFNQLNARLIEFGEFNIFAGIFRNWLFIFVTLLTFAVQIAMVEVGGQITKCYPLGWNENYVAAVIGSGELLWGLVIKLMPLALFQCISLDESPVAGQATLTSMMKKSSVVARPQQIRAVVDENIRERMLQGLKNREAQVNGTSINDA